MESQLEIIRVVIQADPVPSQLNHEIFQGWQNAMRSILRASTHSGTTQISYQ